MMNSQPVIRDERYYAVENASYRFGYLVLAVGAMVLIIIRAILFQQTNWDFFALVWISSIAVTVYQTRHKILPYSSKSFFLMLAIILLVSAAAAVAIILIKTFLKI